MSRAGGVLSKRQLHKPLHLLAADRALVRRSMIVGRARGADAKVATGKHRHIFWRRHTHDALCRVLTCKMVCGIMKSERAAAILLS